MRGCPSAGHGWSCEGPWEVIGRPGVSLGGHGRCLVCTWSGLERPRRSLGGPSTSLEASLGSLEVLGGSSGGHKGSLDVPRGVLGGPWGGPWEVPGGPWGGLGGPQNRRCFFRASREGPGEPLGWFWCSEVVLGSVLGSQHVVISLIIVML